MDPKSSLICKSPNSKLTPTAFLSPGNNPFDDIWKKTLDAVSMSERINRRSSIQLPADISNSGRRSLSFCDLNASDFGRESLGILPSDFGRDSLGFMNINCLETDRESLGIIQISALRESLGFRRESLGILNLKDLGRESLDSGRESLGILHLKSPDVKFGDEEKRIPDIMLTTIEENSGDQMNVLDTAFLLPYSRKSSTLSSSSSVNPSFNSLEGPSRIYSVSSTNFKNTVGSVENLTYSVSSAISSIHSPLNKGRIFSPSELNMPSRIKSVPASLQGPCSPLFEKTEFGDTIERKFWSADRNTCLKSLERRSFREVIDFKEADTSSEFHDSVFIEGHVLAEKFADGSILNESSVGEVGVLDSTPQPDWPDDLSYNDSKINECPKCDTGTVFKTVDKMLPQPVKDILDAKLKLSKSDSNSSNENVEKANSSEENHSKLSQTGEQSVSKLLHNISDIHHEPKKLSTNRKDPKEILENLSELLNSTNASDKQKCEGKNLLNSLADMLGESKSSVKNNQDDSGHSSINEQSDSPNKENHEFFEVLDLRIKSTDDLTSKESCTKSSALDLCLKSRPLENVLGKRLSQSLCSSTPNIKLVSQTEKNNASASSLNNNKTSNLSVASNDSKNTSNVKTQISGKFRQRQFSTSSKKGPMKAIIPVGDMKKKNNTTGTPEKNEQMVATMQSKRTSTPISEPKLKPMAASTPTPHSSKETTRTSKNFKNNGTSSAAAIKKPEASNSFTRARAYSSTSLPRSSMTGAASKLRRNSVSDVKKPTETLHRRNSVEKESAIISSVARARQNFSNSHQKQNVGAESKTAFEHRGKLTENRHLPVPRSSNLDSKSKANKKVTPDKQKQNCSATESPSKSLPSPQQRKCKGLTPSHETTKTGLHQERRNSLRVFGKNNDGNVKDSRRNSMGNTSGMMSFMAKIRQNMLESPHFLLKKEDASNKSCVLSENKGFGRATVPQFFQLKKTGKENTEK